MRLQLLLLLPLGGGVFNPNPDPCSGSNSSPGAAHDGERGGEL
jgi:hypothetical protein